MLMHAWLLHAWMVVVVLRGAWAILPKNPATQPEMPQTCCKLWINRLAASCKQVPASPLN